MKLKQMQEYMAQMAEEDRKIRSIEVEGESMEETLDQASLELGIPVRDLEFEVHERGGKGFWGVGKNKWRLRVYEKAKKVKLPGDEEESFEGLDLDLKPIEVVENTNGEAFVRITQDGVFLKVSNPTGKGLKVTEKQALDAIRARSVVDFDAALTAKIVRRADDEYVRIGTVDYNPMNDSTMTIEISEDEMKAFMEVKQPGPGGTDITYENMVSILENNGVKYGIKEDMLKRFEDYPEYNDPVLAAEGKFPENGADAKVVYNFKLEAAAPNFKEKDGRIDFKELDLIENVVAGQILSRKVALEQGSDGRTVTGRTLPAKAGRDTEISIGKNVKLSEDRLTALAELNGQVTLLGGKINVEPVYTVSGDVNLHTGNIIFLGSVIIKGSVEDGFTVKASGNIEVNGSVGKCNLDADGDIIVYQGILGKNMGKVNSSRSVYAKFIEHAHVEAVDNVVANEGILHSFIDANKKIICQGRRASIVGGRLRAAEEIIAKNLGSIAGAETILEVGYDPQSKEKMVELESSNREIMKKLEELELNIKTLANLKKVQKKLPEEKEKYYEDLIEKRAKALAEVEAINKGKEQIKERLASIKLTGKVSASEKVFAGVRVFIKDAFLEVRNEFKSVTFVLENNMVKVTKYEEPEEDYTRGI
jgi:uncharacterized protein (DUF342 family)